MEFSQPKGIYEQIAEQLCERILEGEWADGERLPSVRELGSTLGVNPNTVNRSYQLLLGTAVIENRRGIGYFVAAEAKERIRSKMKARFVGNELPKLFASMRKLELSLDDLITHYNRFASIHGISKKK